jgi:peptide/nickel transport system substrate-binding protein
MMGKRRRTIGTVGLALVVVLVAAACGGGNNNTNTGTGGSSGGTAQKGGVYRTALSNFDFTQAFDPTAEYLGLAFDFYGALLRNLVSYKHTAGPAGNKLYPDLAQSLDNVTSSDGLKYTFKLKPNIKFGPPVNRAITSKDVEYAFERMNITQLAAGYGTYFYGIVKGMDGKAKDAKPISGIETPDDQTIIFNLTQPTGDFLFRLSMPAAAPIPQEVAKCFNDKAGAYGRYVISSGPYMLQGSDKLDLSSCGAMKPISGFDPTKKMVMVRNPNYDQSTDDLRGNYVDGIDIRIDSNVDDIFNKVLQGSLDGSLADQPPNTVVRQYLTDPNKKNNLHSNAGDRTWYLFMNFSTPPFDDIHVRKAANFIMNKAGILRAWGGTTFGQIATHIMPPTVINNALGQDFDPYASPNFAGDEAKAKAEMKQSKYDSNKDGVCDASACKGLIMINRNRPPWTTAEPVVVDSLSKIGIQVKPRELADHYPAVQTVKNQVPIGLDTGWGKDYPDASTFAIVLFKGSSIIPTNNTNYSLVGVTPSQVKSLGIKMPAGVQIPSVDADIDNCQKLSAATQADQRNACWVNLDKKIMTDVVPWIPYLWSNVITTTAPSVTKYDFDQFSGQISLTQIAVNNKQTISNS